MNLAETLLEEHENSPAELRRRRKEKLKALREHLQKNKKNTWLTQGIIVEWSWTIFMDRYIWE